MGKMIYMKNSRDLVTGAMIAALYAVLTIAFQPIGYGVVQMRISEALCILPFFTPSAVWGLFVGCVIANLFSPYGIVDVIFGSLATLLSALCTYYIARKVSNQKLCLALLPLPPVIFNGLIIGALITFTSGVTSWLPVFAVTALQIAGEEALSCYILGLILLTILEKTKLFESGRKLK